MRVSAISSSNNQTVFFNTKTINNEDMQDNENPDSLNNSVKNRKIENQKQIFENIYEWKNFCHSLIEKGQLDLII